ncbi:TlpA family protein disulfide reductase [Nocardia africana]|uniref:Thiol-disulfide oxidoreductase resA n=1 Tax=Nocardia africana TaxID=134964 RepID=A0A378X225_9NOCA|nr:TlpA disulfide reductase family protein [Nocardia africana]SUA47498.1 Thiol-disulfide oxidoreductase resA [Nocardia africana]
MSRRLRILASAALTAATLIVAACGTTGKIAATKTTEVPHGTFDFVSSGGNPAHYYDPPSARGTIGDLSGPDVVRDTTIHVSDFPGKVVVVNMWGSWCAPCRAEIPGLQQAFAQTQAAGVQFLGVDVRDLRSAATAFISDRAVTYPSIFDPDMTTLGALGAHYPTSVVPTTVVLDRRHRVAAGFIEPLRPDVLVPTVQRLAAEP